MSFTGPPMSPSSKLATGPHEFTTPSGAVLSYFVTGHGPHVLVNIAPGWGPASVVYQNSFGFLDDLFTFVHLEVRGTRRSTFPPDLRDMSSWHMAEDVEALRMYLDLDALDVAGHSNGACIAQWFAIRFPTRVRRLVLVGAQLIGAGSVAGPAMNAILDARPDQEHVRAFRNYDPSSLQTDDDFAAALGSFLPLYVANPERDFAKLTAAFTNKPQLACRKAQSKAESQHANQADLVSSVPARTLVIVGKEDFICPLPVSQMIVDRVTDSILYVVEDAGHFTWIEKPEEFRAALSGFYGAK
ncbi:alpha/beta-hydrolase [Exidia glandulosa HHB12029]|uniref:Alpha/beta-hydrolase n=1 Tax=Exidia glandulosa HHB12029 TaxID=1314781 RepID=A0A165DZ87_EXIGL|nr:alpha/beta-hydrolase [Exidia glandulosa HHB12029]